MYDSRKNPRAKKISDAIVDKILSSIEPIKQSIQKKIQGDHAREQDNPFAVFDRK